MAEEVKMTPIDAAEMTPVTAAVPPKTNPLPKPGLKLPPKPVISTAGLKLPPKPGITIGAKPLIRKPGGAGITLPKPVTLPKPIGAAAPAAKAVPTPAAPKAVPVAAAQKPLDALKSVTQNLKGVTQAIPQQAILHKTGIIADSTASEVQKEAAKHKTARISLSDAMGVAPVKDEHAPMKTIRIKRPVNITGAAEKPQTTASAPVTPAGAPSEAVTSVTQRKTLKISRPTATRPANKFGIKKSEEAAPAPVEDEIADIPDMPTAIPPVPQQPVTISDVPAWATTLATIVQAAACVAIIALVWLFFKDAQLPTFCGGLGWNV